MNSLAVFRLATFGWVHLPQLWATTDRQLQVAQSTPDPHAVQRHHLAWHRAYHRLAALYPQWVQRRFDAEFLRRFVAAPTPPTAAELALVWDLQFGSLTHPAVRCQQRAELTEVATCFLRFYESESQQGATSAQ